MRLNKKKRSSVRWQPREAPLVLLEDHSLGGAKMISNTKLGRLKSAAPVKHPQFDDSESDISDPEIKRIKRKASV